MWWSAVLAHRSKFLCRRRGAFYMRPCCLTGAGRADMESAPTVLFSTIGRKLHILYYFLFIIFYF